MVAGHHMREDIMPIHALVAQSKDCWVAAKNHSLFAFRAWFASAACKHERNNPIGGLDHMATISDNNVSIIHKRL